MGERGQGLFGVNPMQLNPQQTQQVMSGAPAQQQMPLPQPIMGPQGPMPPMQNNLKIAPGGLQNISAPGPQPLTPPQPIMGGNTPLQSPMQVRPGGAQMLPQPPQPQAPPQPMPMPQPRQPQQPRRGTMPGSGLMGIRPPTNPMSQMGRMMPRMM
jgi:hypothetical protein